MGFVCIGCPYLSSGQAPPCRRSQGPRANARKIGTRTGLAHTDAKEGGRCADSRQVERSLFVRAVSGNQRPTLAVRDPMRGNRSANGQQLLYQHEAGKWTASTASVFFGQCQTDPALLRQLPTETGIEPQPRPRGLRRRTVPQCIAQEAAHWRAQSFILGGNAGEREPINHRVVPVCVPRQPSRPGGTTYQ